jgi:hypothetical protein
VSSAPRRNAGHGSASEGARRGALRLQGEVLVELEVPARIVRLPKNQLTASELVWVNGLQVQLRLRNLVAFRPTDSREADRDRQGSARPV